MTLFQIQILKYAIDNRSSRLSKVCIRSRLSKVCISSRLSVVCRSSRLSKVSRRSRLSKICSMSKCITLLWSGKYNV